MHRRCWRATMRADGAYLQVGFLALVPQRCTRRRTCRFKKHSGSSDTIRLSLRTPPAGGVGNRIAFVLFCFLLVSFNKEGAPTQMDDPNSCHGQSHLSVFCFFVFWFADPAEAIRLVQPTVEARNSYGLFLMAYVRATGLAMLFLHCCSYDIWSALCERHWCSTGPTSGCELIQRVSRAWESVCHVSIWLF